MYYMIAGASRIVTTQLNDQIGSIATFQTIADWKKYSASLGLDIYSIYAAASSEKNEEVRQFFESRGKKFRADAKAAHNFNHIFHTAVNFGRRDRRTGKG